MTDIKCQACDGHDIKHGCSVCGGYRVLLQRAKCFECKTPYWVRPGQSTMWIGKEWRSFDGLALTWLTSGPICVACNKKRLAAGETASWRVNVDNY